MGQETSFRMWALPLTTDRQHSANPAVFIVDDDPAVRDSIKLLIESYGWPVRTFDSAQAFLDGYRPEQDGCLILDLHMPGMNGVELQERLVQLGISLPVIIATAHKEEVLIQRARRAGARAVMMKPFKGDELMTNIERALGRAQ